MRRYVLVTMTATVWELANKAFVIIESDGDMTALEFATVAEAHNALLVQGFTRTV